MLIIDSDSYSGFPFNTDVPGDTMIIEAVVSGTHMAGKSTLTHDYGRDTSLLEADTGVTLPSGFKASLRVPA